MLLVDDDAFCVFLAEAVLKKAGVEAEILRASHGREALAVIREACLRASCPELVLLDLHMPVMGGLAFLEELQECADVDCAAMRVVILSSSLHGVELAGPNSLPLVGCIEKPLTVGKLAGFL